MAALAMQARKPIAGFQPVELDVLKAFATGNQKTIGFGDAGSDFDNQKADYYFIGAKELAIARPECWKYTKENGMDVAGLTGGYFVNVKGAMDPLKFQAGKEYTASFFVQRTSEARNLNKINLTLHLNDGTQKMRVVDLTEIAADTWVYLKVDDFKANGNGGEMTVSLTNLEATWKTGLKIAGVLVVAKV